MDQLARAIRLSVRPLETGLRPLKTALFSACLSVLTHAAYADVIQGSSSSETLNGTGSDDTFQLVSGANGFDAFNGDAGQDLIQGTALDDIIGITSLSDIETIDGGDGFDTLQAPGGQNAAIDLTNITVSNIEEIRGGTSNDTIKGSQSADVIIGGAGRDNIYGNGGDDTFYLSLTDISPDNYDGGDGYDSIIGTAGDDVMYISTLLANMELIDGLAGFNVIQAINGTNQGINLTGITVNNIDELRGGTSQDTIRGSEGNDRIIGGLGRDTLYGNGGDDTFVLTFGDTRNDYDGGAGFDTIIGTASDDILYTNVFFRDIERIDGGDGYNVVQAINGTNQAINFENVELINIHELRGGTSQDTIKGSQGGEIIAAGTGTDVVWGYAGNDTYRYIAGDGRDTFYNTGATAADIKTLDIQDVSSTDLTFSRESDDLVITLLQANDSIRIKHWYADTNQRMDQITTIDNSISPEDAENAVLNGGILDGGSSSSSASSSSSSSSSSGSANQPPVFQSATQVDINTSPEIHQVQATDPDGDAITFSLASGPDGLSINATTGMLYWVSPPLGEYVIIVEASDGINVASSHTLILNIHVEPNVAPVAENGVIAIDEDNIANFALVATDDNNDPLTYIFVSQPSHGQLSGTAPNIIYTPVEDYFGMDSFSFKVNDGTLDSDVATVTINITPVNDQPSIISIPLDNTKSNMSYIYQLEVNDIDSESHLTYQLLTGPEGLTINPNTGLVEWFPSDFAIGDHNIILQVTDDGGLSDTQAYTLTVEANNHAPFALNQNENVDEDNVLNIVLTAGDIDNDVLTYTILTQPTNGQLTGTAPNLIYTPAENFNGQDRFTYYVNDGQIDSSNATVLINVASVNDNPIISSSPVTLGEEAALYSYSVSVSDADSTSHTFRLISPPADMAIDEDGVITWEPGYDSAGDHTITVEASDDENATGIQIYTLTIANVNRAPIAENKNVVRNEGEALNITLSARDDDGDNLTYQVSSQPTRGQLAGIAPDLVYTPNENDNGDDSFTFIVNDGEADSYEATISISVQVADAAGLRGTVWQDFDGDGAWGVEPLMPGVTVYLDDNKNGIRDDGERFTVSTIDDPSTTDVNEMGQYRFDNLAPGDYLVSQELPLGLKQTFPVETSDPTFYGVVRGFVPNVSIVEINSRTAEVIDDIYFSSVLSGADAMEMDDNGMLWGIVYDNVLFRYSFVTETLDIIGTVVGFEHVEGLAFYNGVMYAAASINTDVESERLISINLDTLETVDIGLFGGNATRADCIAVSPDGDIYITSQYTYGEDALYRVDRFTGEATFIGAVGYIVGGLEFDDQGVLWGATSSSRVAQPQLVSNLIKINLDSGQSELVNQIQFTHGEEIEVVLGLAFVPSKIVAGSYRVLLEENEIQSDLDFGNQYVIEITSEPPTESPAVSLFEYDVNAVDPFDRPLTYELIKAPASAEIDSQSGVISWLPTLSEQGGIDFVVRVFNDEGREAFQSFTVLVNDPPSITSTPILNIGEGSEYIYDVVVSDSTPGDQHQFRLEQSPEGMSIDPQTGRVNWSPFVHPGVGYRFFDDFNDGDLDGWFDRNDQPREGVQVIGGVITQFDDLAWTGRKHWADYTVAVDIKFPFGATNDSGFAILSTTVGNFYTVYLNDQGVRLTRMVQGNWHIDYIPVTPFTVEADTWYRLKVVIDGSTMKVYVDDELIVQDDNLLWNNGTFGIWANTQTDFDNFELTNVTEQVANNDLGAHPITIVVDDKFGGQDSQSYDLTVEDRELPPVITSDPVTRVKQSDTYYYLIHAYDPDDDQLTFSLIDPPAGMSINTDFNGEIVWDTSGVAVGQYPVKILLTDETGLSVEQEYTVSVYAGNSTPIIESSPIVNVLEGIQYEYHVIASDADAGDVLSYSLDASPLGLSIDPTTGVIKGSAVVGNHLITVRVTDFDGAFVTQSFDLSVTEDSEAPEITLAVTPNTIYIGDRVNITLNATDNSALANVTVRVNNVSIDLTVDANGLYQGGFLANTLGQIEISAFAMDVNGNIRELSELHDVLFDNQAPTVDVVVSKNPVALGDSVLVSVLAHDNNEVVNRSLTVNGQTVTLNANHEAEYTPTEIGTLSIVGSASDAIGNNASSEIIIPVLESDTSAPVITAYLSPRTVYVGDSVNIIISAVDDSSPLNIHAQVNGETIQLDENNRASYVTTEAGTLVLDVTASDPLGNNAAIQESLPVLTDSEPPVAQLISSQNEIAVGGTVTFTALAQDNRGVGTRTVTVNGQPLVLDAEHRVAYTVQTNDDLNAQLVVTDLSGNQAIDNLVVSVVSQTDDELPIAIIHDPTVIDIITDKTSVIATIDDDNLVNYELLISAKDQEQWKVIATGDQPVNNTVIGEIVTTDILNGQYDLRLIARDIAGNQTIADSSVIVEGDLKVGNFSFTVEDLNIPLAGIPIQVTRTYDSRRRHEDLDFGYGWTIDYQNVKIEESRVPGAQWSINEYSAGDFNEFIYLCVEPNGKPIISITLPNGDVEKFEVTAQPDCNFYHVDLNVSLKFTAIGDTQSTLQTSDFNAGRMWNGEEIRTPEGDRLLDFQKYVLTTKAGYIYHLDQDFGIEHVIDPNGYTLTYTDDGIFHSSGKAIFFERDALGRITEVIAPSGEKLIYSYDVNGDLNTVTDRDTAVTTYTYNNNHGLLEIIDPLDRKIVKNIYDDEGRLTSQEDGDGNIKTFNHDLDAKTSLVTDRDGRSTLYEYDDRGNVLFETQLIGDGSYSSDIVTSYTYDANDNQATKTIGTSVWQSVFDDKNNQLSATDPEDNTVYYSDYNGRGQEGTIEDELGRIHTMSYDVAGNLYRILGPEVTDPDTGEVTRPLAGNIINAKGLVNSTTDMRGFTTSYTYYESGNGEGLKHTESNDIIGTITYTYDANNNVTSEQRERTVNGVVVQEVMTYEYDTRDRLIKTIYPDTTYTQTVYDLAGNMDKERDRFGNWTDYTYDAYGRLTHTLYPDGSEETRTYTQEGLLHTVTDQSGMVTRNKYDDAGRLWKVHNDTAGTYTETQYTEQGWVHNEWDENRNRTEYVYDRAGRRTDVIRHYTDDQGQAATQQHSFTYYANGELHTETDANNHTTTYILNALDQRIETRFENTTVTKQRFDAMGTRIASIDQENRKTRFDYDDSGRLEGVTPEVQINGIDVPTTSYTYDEVGNKLTQTDANGHTTTWTYDYFGRVLTRTLPELQQESFHYSTQTCGVQPVTTPQGEPAAQCQVITQTDFNGDTITTQMDNMGRTDTVTYSKDGRVETYTYYPNGQTHTVTTPEGVTTYGYDNRNRLNTETRPSGEIMEYGYDDVGNRTLVKVTRNATVTSQTSYTYDGLNRLKTVTNDLQPSDVTSYTYDAVGNLETVTYANGMVTSYDYNTINQLTDVTTRDSNGVIVGHYHYTLKPTGRREIITEHSGRTTAYCYDDLYRLTDEVIFDSVTTPLGTGCLTDTTGASYTANYQYDWTGNRTYETVDGIQTAYTYDDNDRLLQTGGTVYGYDDNGNTLTETLDANVTSYTYDGRNKLISVTKAGNTTDYTYNHNGIRTSKTEGGITTQFIVDENRDYAQVLEEINLSTNETVVKYTYGHDLINQTRNTVTNFYHYDALGSTRALSDNAGIFSDEYNYFAFGKLDEDSRTGTTENDYLFHGEQRDETLDQYYLRARYYGQGVGRFTSMDYYQGRISEPATLHKYLFTHADPINGIDPSGYYTQAFGNEVERVLQPYYENDHPFDCVVFGKVATGSGSRACADPHVLKQFSWPRAKPDILNHSIKAFNEIKPFSPSGIAKGEAQIIAYTAGLFPYVADFYWVPPETINVNGEPVAVFNFKGVIFYTDNAEMAKEAVAVSTWTALRAVQRNSGKISKLDEGAVINTAIGVGIAATTAYAIYTAQGIQAQVQLRASLGGFGAFF